MSKNKEIIYPVVGYKKALSCCGTKYVIITLSIIDGTLSNLNAPNIEKIEYASYITNQALVVEIEDDTQTKYLQALSAFYPKQLMYEKGKIINTKYNQDSNEGIHFFLLKQLAVEYGIKSVADKSYILNKHNTISIKNYEHDNSCSKIVLFHDKNIIRNEYILMHILKINNMDWRLQSRDVNIYSTETKLLQSYYKNGQLESSIPYVDDNPHGRSLYYYENGLLRGQIEWINGKISGILKYADINTHISYTIEYLNNEYHGLFSLYYQGEHCNMSFKNGVLHGPYTLTISNIIVLDGIFSNGQPNSKFKLKSLKISDNDLVIDYLNGKINGELLVYNSDILLSKTNYIDGLINGDHIKYDKNGNKLTLTTYINDEICGIYVSWYPNMKCHFITNIISKKNNYSNLRHYAPFSHVISNAIIHGPLIYFYEDLNNSKSYTSYIYNGELMNNKYIIYNNNSVYFLCNGKIINNNIYKYIYRFMCLPKEIICDDEFCKSFLTFKNTIAKYLEPL